MESASTTVHGGKINVVWNYKHLCAENGKKTEDNNIALLCIESEYQLKLLWSPGVSLSIMEEESMCTAGPCKKDVVDKIVTFLSNQMEQDTEFQIYTTDIMDVFKKEFSDTAKQDTFKTGLGALEETLATMGKHPEGHPITVVPDGAVKSFFVSPMQLGYQEDDALKGTCGMS